MIPSVVMQYLFESARKFVGTTWPSAVVALAAWISIVVSIDPAGSYPGMPAGPGLTIDEIFNVEQGVYLVEQSRALGWFNLIPGTSSEAFRHELGYNPDHPPLGRYWLGLHHQLTWWIAPPFQPEGPFVTACARTGSATAFALTIWLLGAFVTFAAQRGLSENELSPQWQGAITGLVLILMPRLYGHAHLAALETITNLTCTAAVLAVATGWNRATPPSRRAAILAGMLMGLALLTKIQSILIPMPVIVWTLLRWRQHGIVPLLIWFGVASLVFFAGWPYIWHDPVGHVLEYLGRTTNRVTLNCYYFGTAFQDRLVPWHYPFVMFAVTVPIGLQCLGLAGLVAMKPARMESQIEDRWQTHLLLACGLFPLIVFSIPGIAVYDGERLFLTVFPIWAIFVGRGIVAVMTLGTRRIGWRQMWLLSAVLGLIQFGANFQSHPVYLSYYNLAVGGTSGAERLGLEMNYWGDSLTRDLLQEAVTNHGALTTVEILPSLHQFQNDDLLRQSPILRSRLSQLKGTLPLRLAFRRRADLNDTLFQKYQSDPGDRLAGFQRKESSD